MPSSHTVNQVAVLLGISKRTVYNRIKQGLLQTIQVDGSSKSQRVTDQSLQKEIQRQKHQIERLRIYSDSKFGIQE